MIDYVRSSNLTKKRKIVIKSNKQSIWMNYYTRSYTLINRKRKVSKQNIDAIYEMHLQGMSSRKICHELGWTKSKKSTVNYILADIRSGKLSYSKSKVILKSHLPKVLLFDIETAPNKMMGWGLWNQNFGLNQIENEWFSSFVLS